MMSPMSTNSDGVLHNLPTHELLTVKCCVHDCDSDWCQYWCGECGRRICGGANDAGERCRWFAHMTGLSCDWVCKDCWRVIRIDIDGDDSQYQRDLQKNRAEKQKWIAK